MFLNENKDLPIVNQQQMVHGIAENFYLNHLNTNNIISDAEMVVEESINEIEKLQTGIVFDEFVSADISAEEDLGKINNLLPLHLKNILTCGDELVRVIKSRASKKSSGMDQMPTLLIKHFSFKIILFFTILFNHILANGYFPISWKKSVITPIPKIGKDISIVKNWRPISNLSALSKIFEKILQSRILLDVQKMNIMKTQFGFRGNHSTVHPLAILQNSINNNINQNKFTTLISLDLISRQLSIVYGTPP